MRAGARLLALALCWSAGAAGAETGTERLARQVAAAQPALARPLLEARAACGEADRLCLARHLVEAAPTLARLAPAPHQDTDTIRWAATRPSVRLAGSTITIDGFGRKVRPELAATVALLDEGQPFTVDLRANGGGDIERMRVPIEQNELPPAMGQEADTDLVSYLRNLSGDEAGREILAIILELLDAGYAHVEPGTSREVYVWPYFAALPFDRLTPQQEVDLFRIITPADRDDMAAHAGQYTFFRLGIGPDGTWYFLLAGD